MKKILLVTGNGRKVWQAQTVLEPLGIKVDSADLDIKEIQSHASMDIAEDKANRAYKLAKKPLIICDYYWSIPALKGFPGGYMKDISTWFTTQDWLALMSIHKDRSVILTETLVYTDGKTTKTFTAKFSAHFIHEARGKGQFSGERVAVYDGFTETIAQKIDKGEHARDMSKSAWLKFGKWYSKKK